MARYARLYFWFLVQHLKTLAEYRFNFFLGAISTVSLQAAALLTIWVVMRQVTMLRGFRYHEVLLVFGVLTLSKSIAQMFADNLWTLGNHYIRSGGFDRFLLRPIDPLFHLLADRFNQSGVGYFVVGLVLVVKACAALDVAPTAARLAWFVAAVAGGGAIFVGINLITAATAFWIIDSTPVTLMAFQTSDFAKYPLSIYGRRIRLLMTWVIPYGFASFYPAQALVGHEGEALVWLGPPIGAALLAVGYGLWRLGLRRYSGTGT